MNLNTLEQFLRDTLANLRLDEPERQQLKQYLGTQNEEKLNFIRNQAFALAREQLAAVPENHFAVLKWLENIVKTMSREQTDIKTTANFSPGLGCKKIVCDMLHKAEKNVDICVFTIADDMLTKAIAATHRRGVNIRIITDDDKSLDRGSDIQWLKQQGIPLVMDNSPYHMHHKFALFDRQLLLNGSFNWTRSASDNNNENILTTSNMALVSPYQREFDKLWLQFNAY